jgi:hypothetical protein
MEDRDKPWYHWQIRCQEDGDDGWTCIANINGGKAGPCMFRSRGEAERKCPVYKPEG